MKNQTTDATGTGSGHARERRAGPRLHHVAVHLAEKMPTPGVVAFDEVVVFGTELEALRHIVGKPGWEYKALANGQAFNESSS